MSAQSRSLRRAANICFEAAQQLAPESRTRYDQALISLGQSLGDTPINEITTDDIEQALVGRSPSSRNVCLAALNRIYKREQKLGNITANPVAGVERGNAKPKPNVEPYTEEEMDRIEIAADQWNKEMYCVVLLLRHTAMRLRDVMTLAWADIGHDGMVRRRANKNGNEIAIPVPGQVIWSLQDLRITNKGAYIFWSGRSEIRTLTRNTERKLESIFTSAHVEGAYAHRYRHTMATRILAKDGATINDVADILGITPEVAYTTYAKWSSERQNRIRRLLCV